MHEELEEEGTKHESRMRSSLLNTLVYLSRNPAHPWKEEVSRPTLNCLPEQESRPTLNCLPEQESHPALNWRGIPPNPKLFFPEQESRPTLNCLPEQESRPAPNCCLHLLCQWSISSLHSCTWWTNTWSRSPSPLGTCSPGKQNLRDKITWSVLDLWENQQCIFDLFWQFLGSQYKLGGLRGTRGG